MGFLWKACWYLFWMSMFAENSDFSEKLSDKKIMLVYLVWIAGSKIIQHKRQCRTGFKSLYGLKQEFGGLF